MLKTREVEIRFSGERIIQAVVLEDGSCKLVVQAEVNQELSEDVGVMEQADTFEKPCDDVFVLVEASKLSLSDRFMKHSPKNEREKKFKELLKKVIKKGINDFYRMKYDPSFNGDGTGVTFEAGNKPAVGKSYNWWKKVAKEFMPEQNSRLGTKSEYVAFLGVLIKKLVEGEKWSVAKAWDAVCNNSKELGHYWDSEDAKHELEETGMREICGFFDLVNTCKILAEDEDDFWLAGGDYVSDSGIIPLADLYRYADLNDDSSYSVGWFVLS